MQNVYVQNCDVITNEEPLPEIDWNSVFALNEKQGKPMKIEEEVVENEAEEVLPELDWEAAFRR